MPTEVDLETTIRDRLLSISLRPRNETLSAREQQRIAEIYHSLSHKSCAAGFIDLSSRDAPSHIGLTRANHYCVLNVEQDPVIVQAERVINLLKAELGNSGEFTVKDEI